MLLVINLVVNASFVKTASVLTVLNMPVCIERYPVPVRDKFPEMAKVEASKEDVVTCGTISVLERVRLFAKILETEREPLGFTICVELRYRKDAVVASI